MKTVMRKQTFNDVITYKASFCCPDAPSSVSPNTRRTIERNFVHCWHKGAWWRPHNGSAVAAVVVPFFFVIISC